MQSDDPTIGEDQLLQERSIDDPIDPHSDGELSAGMAIEEAPARKWRVAEALLALRQAVNTAAPRRGKAGDGTIGDAAHASRASDHNPWIVDVGTGVVTGMDITHDPAGGCDAHRLADVLRRSQDSRIKYVISNRRIASAQPKGEAPAWAWRTYTGANPHNHHAHFSVVEAKAGYDDARRWPVEAAFVQTESVATADDPDETLAEVERGLAATIAGAADQDVPLLVRLTALEASVDALIVAYNQAVRSSGIDAASLIEEAPAPTFDALRGSYQSLFDDCAVPAAKAGVVAWHRIMLAKGRPQYERVAAATGVPWWFVGIVHGMEASFSFTSHLHNGDPLSARTVQVPSGRPIKGQPPFTWFDSAVDALTVEGFAGQSEWSVPHALYRWEAYNGWGYRRPTVSIPTPYLWSFSNHYDKGKFVRDGVFDRNARSAQCGAAVMLKALQRAGDVVV